jgi:hypothetical protein
VPILREREVKMMVASSRTRRRLAAALVLVVAGALTARVLAQPPAAQPQIDVDARLKGFDDYMAQVLAMRQRDPSGEFTFPRQQ